jgi:VanZ family protein
MQRLEMSPRARYAAAALLVLAVIIYGSLYPLEFSARNGPRGPWDTLASTWWGWDHGVDLVSNLIFYFPLGFFLLGALPGRRALAFGASVLFGAALSCAMELLQFYVPGRDTTMGDVYANALGTAWGAVAGAVVGTRSRWALLADLAADPPAMIVLGAWFGARCYPYVPEEDPRKYWHAVRDIVLAPSIDPIDLLRYAAAWLAVAAIVDRLYGFRRWLLVFPLLLGAEFAARVVMHGSELKLADIVGGGVAFAGWAFGLRWLPGRLGTAGVALLAVILLLRLEPFAFGAPERSFGWVPFLSLMVGSMNVAIPTFMEKAFFYGGAVWLLWRGGLSLVPATGAVAALLFATSWLEVFLPDRSAEITDALLAIVSGVAFALTPGGAETTAGTGWVDAPHSSARDPTRR